jgi:hypothetical protein
MPLRIENAVDLHCHYGPDTIGGSLEFGDAFNAIPALDSAREAQANGYAAIVLKSHGFANPGLARNLELAVPGLRIFGGICTDHPTGGLNVWAVESALSIGAKIVWLPTAHSSVDFGKMFEISERHRGLGPIRVLDDDAKPLAAVEEIVDLVTQTDAVLATGHISGDEHYAIVKKFAPTGKVLVTHAGESRSGTRGFSPRQCAELADLGATIELTALTCDEVFGHPGKTPQQILEIINAVGPQRCTLSTDYGWGGPPLPRPATGFLEFLESLWELGVPEDHLITMASRNPARLLGLPFA